MPHSALFGLSGAARNVVLQELQAAYAKDPSREHFWLVCFVMSRSLVRWAGRYERAGVLPSHILLRLEAGLQRKKRFLSRWVLRRFNAIAERQRLIQEAESIAAQLVERDTYQAPSDPGLRRVIFRALAKMNPTDRDTLILLAQGYESKDIAQRRGLTATAAWQRVSTARKAFDAMLPKNLSPKRK